MTKNPQKQVKQTKRCELLIDSILKSIYKNSVDNDSTNVVDEAEIIHNGEIVGYVTYAVNRNVVELGRSWSYDTPPSGDEVEVILISAICDVFISALYSKKLRNLTKFINEELILKEGKILEY